MKRRDLGKLLGTIAVTAIPLARMRSASEVEMKPLVGLDGGPMRISGLPSNAFFDYVQYESVTHTYRDPDRDWSYSGTNGFTSLMVASG